MLYIWVGLKSQLVNSVTRLLFLHLIPVVQYIADMQPFDLIILKILTFHRNESNFFIKLVGILNCNLLCDDVMLCDFILELWKVNTNATKPGNMML